MSFKFYKFCQNGLITFLSATFAMFYTLSVSGRMSWWLGLIIALIATCIGFVPPIGLIYPLTFGVFILIALIKAFISSNFYFWILLILFVVHIVRFVAMITFARSNPEKSLQYDEAIRYGINID